MLFIHSTMYPEPDTVASAKDPVMCMVPVHWLHWVSSKDGQLAINRGIP